MKLDQLNEENSMTTLAQKFKDLIQDNDYSIEKTVAAMDVKAEIEHGTWQDSESNEQWCIDVRFVDGTQAHVHEHDVELMHIKDNESMGAFDDCCGEPIEVEYWKPVPDSPYQTGQVNTK